MGLGSRSGGFLVKSAAVASLSLGPVEALALTLSKALGVAIGRTVAVDLLVRATHVVVEAALATLLSGSLGSEATGAFITGAGSCATYAIASTDSGPWSNNWSNSTDSRSNATNSRSNATDSRYYATYSWSYATYSGSNSDAGSDWSLAESWVNNALAESWVNNAAAANRTHRADGSSDTADTGADPSTANSSSETRSNTTSIARASKTDARTDTCTIPSSVATTTVATTIAASVSAAAVAATIISAETGAIASSAKSSAESGAVGRAWAGWAATEASAGPATAQEEPATLDFFIALLLVTGIGRRRCCCGCLACLVVGWLIFSEHCEAQR